MPSNFADRLIDAVAARKAPGVVALDPVYEHLPPELLAGGAGATPDSAAALKALAAFGRSVLKVIAPLVPAVKINVAYFERYHGAGWEAYHELIERAAAEGLLVIGDIKRADVGHTAEMYAAAHLGSRPSSPDAVTVSGYFGWDGVRPFADLAASSGRGLFVLVRTSNPSAADVQDVALDDGRKMHEVVAGQVAQWAERADLIGRRGYSSMGAVVATRDAADAARLRSWMPRSIFLVPGYGAQGGRAEDFAPYFQPDGAGAIVVAGRSVIGAHQQQRLRERFGADWEKCIERACAEFVEDLRRHLPVA